MRANSDFSEDLTTAQTRALVALLNQPTISKAAETAKISEATLFRWLKEESFSSALRAMRKRVMEHAVESVQGKCSMALDTLCDVCEGRIITNAAPRVAAAKAILDFATRVSALNDMWAELEELR